MLNGRDARLWGRREEGFTCNKGKLKALDTPAAEKNP